MRPTPKKTPRPDGKNEDYSRKLARMRATSGIDLLDEEQKTYMETQARELRFSFQELKTAAEAALDLKAWREGAFSGFWSAARADCALDGRQLKKKLFARLNAHMSALRTKPRTYPPGGLCPPARTNVNKLRQSRPGPIAGLCPVASDKTICCRLRTIDAVTNCGFGCSYCIIQSFYSQGRVIFESGLKKKLGQIELNPRQRYHFGTGQSSDSLMWGNEDGLLEDLLDFARKNPNIVLELKTKSAVIEPLLALDVPPNVVCSWSLNTPTVIKNEEHFTAALEERLAAARKAADSGVFTAFHFHPVFYYEGWREDYGTAAMRLMETFRPEEVLFLSFGAITLIRPVISKIRERGEETKVLQMDFAADPHGKLTYTDALKEKLFSAMHTAFKPWHADVLIYLCMEKKSVWEKSFGFSHPDSESFERHFLERCFDKITASQS